MIVINESPQQVIPNISEKDIFKSLIILEMPYHIAFLTSRYISNVLFLNWFGRDIRYDEKGAIWGWERNTNLINFLINCWNRWETNSYNAGNIKIYVCENKEDVYNVINILGNKLNTEFTNSIIDAAGKYFAEATK